MKLFRGFLSVLVSVILLGCEPGVRQMSELTDHSAADKLNVFAVNYPLSYFAQRIGAEQVNVVFPVPPGQDPFHWVPDPETVAAMQRADLILLNGAGYEPWVARVSLPRKSMINSSAALESHFLVLAGSGRHSHGPEGAHSHRETAFTLWLDPQKAIEQARAVMEALTSRRPQQAPEFTERFTALMEELIDLDRRLSAIFSQIVSLPLLFSHPVYQYLIDRYDLKAQSLHWEPQEYPSQSQWQALALSLEEHPAQWMIWEAEPLAETVKQLDTLGVRSLVFDPGANRPQQGDFLSLMVNNADNVTDIVTQ